MNQRPTSDDAAKEWADNALGSIEDHFDSDGIAIIAPIAFGVEHYVKEAIEGLDDRANSLVVILDTLGGVVEVVERVVRVFRRHYNEVSFVIPDRALSAGTILAMSGDAIFMTYHSCLGPIDPQVERDGNLVPALSYLHKVKELSAKSAKGSLTTAEVVLLRKLDLAELHQFELARDFSSNLLVEWLAKYKFKDWNMTETRKLPVTDQMRRDRANEIARTLNDHKRWQTHGRGIDRDTLIDELKLQIDDLDSTPDASRDVWDYLWFMKDFMARSSIRGFVHSRALFL